MNLPVHRSNLLPRGKQVGKYIHIRHSCECGRTVEIWKRFFWFWYIWQETRVIDTPKIKRNKV